MITLLERRRREARDHDQIQRQAEERAAQRRESTPRQLPAPAQPESVSESDLLAALFVSDPRRVVTVADLLVFFRHFEQKIDELRGDDDQDQIE